MAGCCGEGSGAATGELEAAGHTCGGNGLRQMVVLHLLVFGCGAAFGVPEAKGRAGRIGARVAMGWQTRSFRNALIQATPFPFCLAFLLLLCCEKIVQMAAELR